MSSPEPAAERAPSLRRFALETIDYALTHGREPDVDPAGHPEPWRAPRACFVTLRIDALLRGCTGTFDASVPLVVNVARYAHGAAFRDPRFPSVTRSELPALEASISVIGPPEPLPIASRSQLEARVRPRVDGLIVGEGERRATLLPAVWTQLPEPADFVDALLEKAGLPAGYWSPRLRFERYTTIDVE
jgi:AmmeMemoRadiSam system protein A